MARPKVKNSQAINLKIEVGVHKMLSDYCAETGLSKTVVVEKALSEYIEKRKNKV